MDTHGYRLTSRSEKLSDKSPPARTQWKGVKNCVCVLRAIRKDVGIDVDVICSQYTSAISTGLWPTRNKWFPDKGENCHIDWTLIQDMSRFNLDDLVLCIGYEIRTPLFERLLKGENADDKPLSGLTTSTWNPLEDTKAGRISSAGKKCHDRFPQLQGIRPDAGRQLLRGDTLVSQSEKASDCQGGEKREKILTDYQALKAKLGPAGASSRIAAEMVKSLKNR